MCQEWDSNPRLQLETRTPTSHDVMERYNLESGALDRSAILTARLRKQQLSSQIREFQTPTGVPGVLRGCINPHLDLAHFIWKSNSDHWSKAYTYARVLFGWRPGSLDPQKYAFSRAVTSILSQRLLHKMTNSRAVFIARIHVRWTSKRSEKTPYPAKRGHIAAATLLTWSCFPNVGSFCHARNICVRHTCFWKSSEIFVVSARRATMLPRFAPDGQHRRAQCCRHNVSSFCRRLSVDTFRYVP